MSVVAVAAVAHVGEHFGTEAIEPSAPRVSAFNQNDDGEKLQGKFQHHGIMAVLRVGYIADGLGWMAKEQQQERTGPCSLVE